DQSFAQVLPDGADAAAQPDVLAGRRLARTLERRMDAVGHEVEGRAALHRVRRAGVVRQHEDRRVVGRVRAPPALPVVIGPGAADRPEHVPAHDPGAHVLEPARGEIIVDTGLAARRAVAVHGLECPGAQHPLVQAHPADAHRVLQVLPWPRAVAVDRDREAADAQLGQDLLRGRGQMPPRPPMPRPPAPPRLPPPLLPRRPAAPPAPASPPAPPASPPWPPASPPWPPAAPASPPWPPSPAPVPPAPASGGGGPPTVSMTCAATT